MDGGPNRGATPLSPGKAGGTLGYFAMLSPGLPWALHVISPRAFPGLARPQPRIPYLGYLREIERKLFDLPFYAKL